MARLGRLFKHQALYGVSSIRIIKLFPAHQRESSVVIELSEFHLNSSIEYEALSYTWDDQKPTRDVTCNGTTLRVTENVFQALQQLRSTRGRQRMVWIDAICINQKDQAEKTMQVSMMGDIFSRAQRVNIWLSRPTEAMKVAFEYIRLSTGPESKFPNVPNALMDILKDGIGQLGCHPYWTRAWTVQEVALNENCWIYLGQREPMKMSDFGAMLWDVEGHMNRVSEAVIQQDRENKYPVAFQRGSPSTALTLHRCYFGSVGLTMNQETLEQLIGKKAKYPLDVVFASRALFPESIGQIKVDYGRDLVDVLREVTVRIIPGIKKLGELLVLVSHCPAVSGAPSWTLNLTCGEHLHGASHYWAMWRTTNLNSPNTARVSSDGETLHVKGVIVDYVSIISDEFPHYTLGDQARWHEEVHAMLTQWRACTQGPLKNWFEEAIVDVLYAAEDTVKQIADEIGQHVKFQRVAVVDEDGTLLSNSFFKPIYQVDPPDRAALLAENDRNRKSRVSAFSEWMSDPSTTYRLDREEILHSSRAESFCPPTIHSPAIGGRNLFVTEQGKIAVGKNVRAGDAIVLISSCDLPYALRPVAGTDSYTLGQPVVLPGVMLGEAWPEDQARLEEIKIV